MSTVKVKIHMSLDGFVAGPNQSEKDPLGIGGEQLHQWLLPLKAFRETHGEEGGEVNASTPIAEEILGARLDGDEDNRQGRHGLDLRGRALTRRAAQGPRRSRAERKGE